MRAAGQYRLQQALGSCEVGDVWSGTDERGQTVTVAVLNERASADERWRGAFQAATDALAQAATDRLPIVGSDHAGARPWVACAQERGSGAAQIFEALGQPVRPVPAPAPAQDPPAEMATTRMPAIAPEASGQRSGPWDQPPATVGTDLQQTMPVPPQPRAGKPPARPVPVEPTGHEADPGEYGMLPPSPVRPVSGSPVPGGSRFLLSGRGASRTKLPAKAGRHGLRIAAAAIAGLLAGAGGAVAVTSLTSDGTPEPGATTAAAPPTDDQLLLTSVPEAPGVEPPVGGGWPTGWPTFTSTESTKPMNGLDGVGFDFRTPPNWTCTKVRQAQAAVHYRCGAGTGPTLSTGGDLMVRDCGTPCTQDRRADLRQREEAWGLRWTRSGPFTTWAETTQIDGKREYGLVYVAFWRSTPEDRIDRELVLRMKAPLATSDDLKKVANSIRDRTFTL